MPRPPNPKAKTLQLVLFPKEGQEEMIKAFKEICARNNLQISDVLYEKVVAFLREHNYPPGSSQTVFDAFGVVAISPQEKFRLCQNSRYDFSSGTDYPVPLCKGKLFVGMRYDRCRDCGRFKKNEGS